MKAADENTAKDSTASQSWLGWAAFLVGILSWPPFWLGLYAWLDQYMPSYQTGGILDWFLRMAKMLFGGAGSSSPTRSAMSMGMTAGLGLALLAVALAGASLYFTPQQRQGRAVFGLILGGCIWLIWFVGYLGHFGMFK